MPHAAYDMLYVTDMLWHVVPNCTFKALKMNYHKDMYKYCVWNLVNVVLVLRCLIQLMDYKALFGPFSHMKSFLSVWWKRKSKAASWDVMPIFLIARTCWRVFFYPDMVGLSRWRQNGVHPYIILQEEVNMIASDPSALLHPSPFLFSPPSSVSMSGDAKGYKMESITRAGY